jgi:hypothetical protein
MPKKLINENKNDSIQIRMSQGEKLRLLELADRYEVPLSLYVRQLIRREYELTFPEKKAPTARHLGTSVAGPVMR